MYDSNGSLARRLDHVLEVLRSIYRQDIYFFSYKNVHIGLIGRPSIWPCCLCRELMLWTAGYNGPLVEQRPLLSKLRGPETFGARVLQTSGPQKNLGPVQPAQSAHPCARACMSLELDPNRQPFFK